MDIVRTSSKSKKNINKNQTPENTVADKHIHTYKHTRGEQY